MDRPQLPSTEAVIDAVREVARAYGRDIEVTHDIGADRSGRRLSAGAFAVTDPDGSLPHEACIELSDGAPRISIEVFSEDDAHITVEGIPFQDLPRDVVPAFLHSVLGDLTHVKGRFFPPGWRLVVPLPGDETYKELITGTGLTPWLSSRVR
ncbi:hypothetical protein [Streptomyces olivaceiscleroticus]|uniref:Uncharacterized protein n=1 Tax=Streptomyces olivaceiscleroticus TaxID=68245 RepID=A0ABN1A814_9ACTN